jgi:predicted RNA-binding protein with PIN domain
MDTLLVDGYNIIGAWPELQNLKKHNLASARDLLVEKMAEYQAYSGMKVIVVFDAHLSQGIEKKYANYNVEVIFTRENETADEHIERLVKQLKTIKSSVYVATSDFVEQSVTFGQGALRKSARELYLEMQRIEKNITKEVKKTQQKKQAQSIPLSEDVAEIFEKWRRGR